MHTFLLRWMHKYRANSVVLRVYVWQITKGHCCS